jgi:lysozyme family protein
MPTAEQLFDEVEAQKQKLLQARAEAASDPEALRKIDAAIEDVDAARAELALGMLAGVVANINTLRAKVEAATRRASAWPFGAAEAPPAHEQPFRAELQDNDAFDAGPDQPAPAPATRPADKIPAVTPGWSENYQELWRTMTVAPAWRQTAEAIGKKIIASQGRYAAAVAGSNVPWWFVAVVHAMECSLRFDQHLHNGDPLGDRTVRVPRGRPAAGAPPFSWEQSARDSLSFEQLDRVDDWSLPSALFHWHRYNGINNEYKRRNIPTPYLWSGSQHYRKGKYVQDGVFDPEKASGQAGAAVILKALIDLGAVTLDARLTVAANPAAATGQASALSIDTSAPGFAHIAAELDFPPGIRNGSKDPAGKVGGVRRVQEWLNIHDRATSIDGGFGDSTEEQLKKFQRDNGRSPTGELDEETWALLTAPMRRALAAIAHPAGAALEEAVIRVAQQHVAQAPVEVGGDNRGPWVRLYMQGRDGTDQLWCAGFVCFAIAQAARDLGIALPFARQVGVDALVRDAMNSSRFIDGDKVANAITRRSRLRPGFLFVVRNPDAAGDWQHVGIVLNVLDQTFDTLEGNTSVNGSRNGTTAKAGNRSYPQKDFLALV